MEKHDRIEYWGTIVNEKEIRTIFFYAPPEKNPQARLEPRRFFAQLGATDIIPRVKIPRRGRVLMRSKSLVQMCDSGDIYNHNGGPDGLSCHTMKRNDFPVCGTIG